MTALIHELLSRLYDAEDAARAEARLKERMTNAAVKPPWQHALFSEQDVVLITYGDSVRREGESPLRTLRHFARERLDGVISTVHILPFFPYSSDDGFSVQDFYAVNPSLGTWDDVEAIGQDFALMVDAVFNHMSAQSEWFKAFLADDPAYAGLFMTESPETDLSAVVRPRVSPLLTAFEKANGETVHVWTTFSADQVDFDARTPETVLRLIDILLYYVEKGASVIRLDAIAYLWKVAGTSSIHLQQTHDVIKLMRAVLNEVAPHVVLITETNVPHDENISYWGNGHDEAQLVYNFTLPPMLLHTLLTGDSAQLREWVNSLKTPSDQTTFFNFTASHDGIGVRPVEGILAPEQVQALIDHTLAQGGRVSYKQNTDGTQSAYELNITYVNAVIDSADPVALQVKRFLVTQGIMLALAGVPAVYIHSLLGTTNDYEGLEQTGHNRAINRRKLDYDTVTQELDDSQSFRHQVYQQYRKLIQTRIVQTAFHPNAPQQALDVANPAVFALRRGEGANQILALYNLTNQPQPVVLSQRGWDLLGGEIYTGTVMLKPYDILWLALN
jgi:glycosidase